MANKSSRGILSYKVFYLLVVCFVVLISIIAVNISTQSRSAHKLKSTNERLSLSKYSQISASTSITPFPMQSNGMTDKYISMGNIPLTGITVGATFYGALAEPIDGNYIMSNYIQKGVKNGGKYDGYDDNGEGACGGIYENLADKSTWAEDEMGNALGNLPCGTKLEITYNGKSVIAEKADISNGGCSDHQQKCSDNGYERKIDLWWQTAKALCITDQPVIVTIHVVPDSTPTTKIERYKKNDRSSYAVCN